MDNIYKLELNGKSFYVPLWHHEVVFDMSGNDIIVKCLPELDDDTYIDNKNNIHFTCTTSLTDAFFLKKVQVKLGSKTFVVDSDKLHIREHQIYIIKGEGMLRIDSDHLYSTHVRGDIHVNIRLV